MTGNTIVLLAAGLSRRFGDRDKLLHSYLGKPLVAHAAETLTRLGLPGLAVVSSDGVANIVRELGFTVVMNTRPEAGMGHSLYCASRGLGRADHVLIALADMPLVSQEHFERLLDGEAPSSLRATAGSTYRGPPVLVRRATMDAADFTTDQGLRPLLEQAEYVVAPDTTLIDVDRYQDLPG